MLVTYFHSNDFLNTREELAVLDKWKDYMFVYYPL